MSGELNPKAKKPLPEHELVALGPKFMANLNFVRHGRYGNHINMMRTVFTTMVSSNPNHTGQQLPEKHEPPLTMKQIKELSKKR